MFSIGQPVRVKGTTIEGTVINTNKNVSMLNLKPGCSAFQPSVYYNADLEVVAQ